MGKVVLLRGRFVLVRALAWLLYGVLVLPVRSLDWLLDWSDEAEWDWLAACQKRRLAARRRANGFGPGGVR
jgi:hypothetical protein